MAGRRRIHAATGYVTAADKSPPSQSSRYVVVEPFQACTPAEPLAMALSVCAPGVPVTLPFFLTVMVVPLASMRHTSLTAAVPAVLPSWVCVPATDFHRYEASAESTSK